MRTKVGKADDFYRAGIVAVGVYPDMVAVAKLGAVVIIPAQVYATERGKMDIDWTPAPQPCWRHFSRHSSSLLRRLPLCLQLAPCAVGEAPLAELRLLSSSFCYWSSCSGRSSLRFQKPMFSSFSARCCFCSACDGFEKPFFAQPA